ncbi:uncharacterized protein A4U43_C06F18730 [Asparagus officinalis]|uniref:CCHC-type domain-containing protein n=1 Tax=Asparagus officinalis TaxID=4686 RepID=A0A5P1ERV2_ASPOF|nr:uncharacterized protein A4U43_C06F18730 [Asparagus officinalis]
MRNLPSYTVQTHIIENGGCGFFEWCDNQSSELASHGRASTEVRCSSYSLPKLSSEPSFISRQASFSSRAQNTYSNYSSSQSSGERTGSSCFKCGQEGHWARDCTISSFSSNSCADNGGSNLYSSTSGTGSGSGSGSCFKCGKSGHWARDCTISSFSANSADGGGNCLHSGLGSGAGSGSGSGSCFKCGQSGHRARDCTGQEISAVAVKRKASRSFQTPFANRYRKACVFASDALVHKLVCRGAMHGRMFACPHVTTCR